MAIPQNHPALVDRLAADVRPVSRLRPPGARMLAWMTLPTVLLAVVALVQRRADLPGRLQTPSYVLELILFAAGAVLSTWLAFRAAAPDRRNSRAALWLAVGSIGGAVLLLCSPPRAPDPTGGGLAGIRCLEETGLLAAVPWMMLFVALRRGAPVAPAMAGALAGGAAFLLANVAMRIACPSDAWPHVLMWHLLPAGVAAVLSGALGGSWLREWTRPSRRIDSLARR